MSVEEIPAGLGDTFLQWATRQGSGSFGFAQKANGEWLVSCEFGSEAPDSPMVGGAIYGVGDTLQEALVQALADARVNPCGTCGWAQACPPEDGGCHS